MFDAINKRQDDVYRRLYDEFNSDTALFPGHRQRSRGSTNHNETYLLRHLKCI
jgi:hypothetical protein